MGFFCLALTANTLSEALLAAFCIPCWSQLQLSSVLPSSIPACIDKVSVLPLGSLSPFSHLCTSTPAR